LAATHDFEPLDDCESLDDPELLDGVDLPLGARRRALHDLARINRWLFGTRAIVAAVVPRLSSQPASRLLDVAAGAGDAGDAVRRAAGRRGSVEVVSLDRQLGHLLLGRSEGRVTSAVVADAAALPFVDGGFTTSLSTLFFHHLDAAAKGRVLAEMRRVAQHEAIVVDLLPAAWAAAAARLLLPLVGAGRVARLDGYTSFRRSWPVERWRSFLQTLPVLEIRRRFPARVTIVVAADAPRA
jgi:SAM-dependent methyltransferase